VRPPDVSPLASQHSPMADDSPTKPPQDQETRLAQLNRIAAWTEQKPKPEPEAPREEAEAS
jgi:hypothetical protein